jgi:acyl-CoA synthetase (AMP-forming)/AMP-acid ligase II
VDLLDLLEDASSGTGSLRVLPDGPKLSFGRLWEQSELAARALARSDRSSPVVGVVMSTSAEALACLVGGFRAGLTVASLPTPARAMPAEEYRKQIETLCRFLGAELLLAGADEAAYIPGPTIEVRSFAATLADGRRAPPLGGGPPGSFVQLTSGTTAAPKGVSLSLHALATNVLAVLEALAPEPGDVSCSWLPLSHDLGLVGMCLVPWVANAPHVLGSGDAVLLPPSRLGSWLRACSAVEATFTAAPSFALELVCRIGTSEAIDLSHLRGCIVGAETVRASTLVAFEEAAAAWGLGDATLCPAYGLAEATLAVSMVRPGERWTTRTVDRVALANGTWEEAEDGRVLVGNGRPVTGVEVRTAAPVGRIGPLEVRSEAMMSGYVGEAEGAPEDGWLRTRDLGRVVDGEVYVTGRTDDVIIVGGRNFHAPDLELAASGVGDGIRPGGVVVIDDQAGRYVVVAERRSNLEPERAAERIRTALVRQAGPGPSAVLFVSRGSLPKTPSGKPQRYRVQALHDRGALEVEGVVEFAL